MENIFVKNKVIDKKHILSVLEQRKNFTEENLRREWEETKELDKEIYPDSSHSWGEFNYLDYYDTCFSCSILDLTLDELEFICDNNLYEFNNDNLLDYHCQTYINNTINDYKKKIINLTNIMQKENIGSYFQGYPSLFKMSVEASSIVKILGLERENVELTPEGEKLKKCLKNINNMFHESFKKIMDEDLKKLNIDPENLKQR